MDSRISDQAARAYSRSSARDALKIVILGGFGVGKTTMVRAVSEIRPLSTEETMTRAGVKKDDSARMRNKATTTVAFDFGRLSLSENMVLYLFGAPGQERFCFLWDRLFSGALGAVVLVDTRRLADSWYAIDRLEQSGMPFIVARNKFAKPIHPPEKVRDALSLSENVPLIDCDVRKRESSKALLIALVNHLHSLPSVRESTP